MIVVLFLLPLMVFIIHHLHVNVIYVATVALTLGKVKMNAKGVYSYGYSYGYSNSHIMNSHNHHRYYLQNSNRLRDKSKVPLVIRSRHNMKSNHMNCENVVVDDDVQSDVDIDIHTTVHQQVHVQASAAAANISNNIYICDDQVAYPQQTPHSGRHFLPLHPYYSTNSGNVKKKNNNNAWYKTTLKRIIPTSNFFKTRKASHSFKKNRFMEGWYYRLTLPQHNTSIAFMYSIEIENHDTNKNNKNVPSLTAIQIMGPNDTYLVQADTQIDKFWAYEHCQAFGCIFESFDDSKSGTTTNTTTTTTTTDVHINDSLPAKDPESFLTQIKTGYQVLPTKMQGRIIGHDGSLGGVMTNQGISGYCQFDMNILPLSGWGDDDYHEYNANHCTCKEEEAGVGAAIKTLPTTFLTRNLKMKKRHWFRNLVFQKRQRRKKNNNKHTKSLSKLQKSTAGWLASYSIFEPHWQITLADARATGYVNWNGTIYNFTNAPFYVEKNWGSSFPSKWYWIQCNSFVNHERLSLTAGGGIRKLSFFGSLLEKNENLGLVGIHYNGTFYENVPWTGDMEWDIDTWGRWNFKGRCTSGKHLFEVEVTATCDLDSGVMLRVPTKDKGLTFMCRDTFEGRVSLSLFALEYCKKTKGYIRKQDVPPIIDNAISYNCAVEVGGPWEEKWKSRSKMNNILKFLVKIPYLIQW